MRTVLMCFLLACLLLANVLDSVACGQDSKTTHVRKYEPRVERGEIPNFNFQRYSTIDSFDRQITFYVANHEDQESRLPLIVCVQGSGAQSLFLEMETETGKRIVSGGAEAVIAGMYSGKARIMVVEKPGVTFLAQPDAPGSAEEATKEYNREFSLERWTEAVHAATEATSKLPFVDHSRILVLGHSEGGQVACEVAAANENVTHVAVMAGGGPTQLYDLMAFARSGDMYDPQVTASERMKALMLDWQNVVDEPLATDKFFLGHTHLRWSSFLKSSPLDAILKSSAKVFIAQGTADTSTLPASSEMLYAELLARGRDCTFERVEGGDHAFMQPDDEEGKGWVATNKKAVDWFLK